MLDSELEAEVIEGAARMVIATCPYCGASCKWVTVRQGESRIYHHVREVCEHVSSVSYLRRPRIIFKESHK